MTEQQHQRNDEPPLTSWAKVGLLVVAVGLIFGADVAFGFAKSFAQFVATILLGGGLLFAILWSIGWVFNRAERKSGTDAAIIAIFAYLLVGLPLTFWLIGTLKAVFHG